MASRIKKGVYGMTVPRVENILGTVVVCTPRFNNMKGEIIAVRDDHMRYLSVQIQSEYRGRVYVLHLVESQYKDIQWRH
jgi:hypothetical protein